MGSLLPDSSSNKGFRFPLRPIFLDLKIEKTAAASVDDTIEPSNKPSCQVKSPTQQANMPTVKAVSNTPKVERTRPGPRTGRTSFHWVRSEERRVGKECRSR